MAADKKGLALMILGKKRPGMGPPSHDEMPMGDAEKGESPDDEAAEDDALEGAMGDFLAAADAKDAAGMAAAFRAAMDAC